MGEAELPEGDVGAGSGDATGAGAPGASAAADRPAGGRPGVGRPAANRARNVTRGTILVAELESADSLWAKFMGLMGRSTLPSGTGLWLPESNGIHMMFMRFAIDAVFVGKQDADGARPVLAIRRALPAWRGLVPFIRGAHGVLELPVGTIDASGTIVGDRVAIGS
jgi:uncharacterized membrane protein (UPF0127 family)